MSLTRAWQATLMLGRPPGAGRVRLGGCMHGRTWTTATPALPLPRAPPSADATPSHLLRPWCVCFVFSGSPYKSLLMAAPLLSSFMKLPVCSFHTLVHMYVGLLGEHMLNASDA
ncbi:hypothetical protein L226DRAFT_377083 [Lentinus tigrinus ALCF2SS1-7]|uniref:uncharacterized protein n=1 Tax=Lentinus tigrinus ALCF2SS1-7 TaxID=1328758 RepID=UPI001165E5D4|nr:hypothetical protein L226DRAFT_377083 [Lentinus tigrinus ALCF2SS1-7]